TSRRAGMAEMATGVLHNVGNVLTSVNVASSFIAEGLKKSKAANLPRLVALLKQHEADLGAFLTNDPKGRQVLGYLSQLSDHLGKEQEATLEELAQMQKGIEHIKDIVKSQQSCAKHSGKPECVEVSALVEDALRMSASSKSAVQVVQQLDPDLRVTVEKHKVLQILINLIRNGRQACESAGVAPGLLTIRASNGGSHVRIAISDNGQGIAPENLDRIFKHGFTTKKDGHGFGLHSSIQAARDMGGGLRAESAGPGQGATFILELPSAAGTVAKAEH
ncbi:MAG: HAMP domain-containing sensor histidine kinase, partial [Verrucomicrobiota bacterium]